MPKTRLTPQLTIVSAMTSVTVRSWGGSGSRPMKISSPSILRGVELLATVLVAAGRRARQRIETQPCQGQRIQHLPSDPFSMEPSPSGPR